MVNIKAIKKRWSIKLGYIAMLCIVMYIILSYTVPYLPGECPASIAQTIVFGSTMFAGAVMIYIMITSDDARKDRT